MPVTNACIVKAQWYIASKGLIIEKRIIVGKFKCCLKIVIKTKAIILNQITVNYWHSGYNFSVQEQLGFGWDC